MADDTPPDPREPLGRIVHETRRAWIAAHPGKFFAVTWEERGSGERELDMRIGHAVADYALAGNAATYGLACPRCAGFLDRAGTERERAERAEARLAGVRAVLLEGGQDAGTVRRRALAVIGGQGQDRGEEKGAGDG